MPKAYSILVVFHFLPPKLRTNENKNKFIDLSPILLLNSLFISIIISIINNTIKGAIMMESITANELKTKGISEINKILSKANEVFITVRGKSKFVVLSIDEYNKLREYELEAALEETKKDIKEGKFIEESVDDHIKRITNV